MIKTIYFHIGESKTGTSYIQNFMDVNREILFSDHNCLYPNFLLPNLSKGRYHNHASWYNSQKQDEQNLINDVEKMIDFADQHSIPKIILSNEGWLLDNFGTDLIEKIIPKRDDTNIKAICYLRRIDFWIESAWKQWGLKTHDDFSEFIARPEIYNRYKHILIRLNNWADLIGKENLIIRPYEKLQLENGLVADFLNCVGIDFSSTQWNETENTNVATNAGFNRDVLEILNYCHDLYNNAHDNQLFEMFSALLGDKFQKQPFESYALMTPEQRIDVINNNLPYEQEIASKFMGRQDGKIFYDPMPSPEDTYQIYEGLTLEKAVPILVKMINQNYRDIERNNRRINHLERELAALQNSKNNQVSGDTPDPNTNKNTLFKKIRNKILGPNE